MNNKQIVMNVVEKVNQLYKQIKKNECSPNTEYLFANVESENNFEQSMRKMEMLNNMDFTHM